MKRTPVLVAAAAALGLLWGLGLEASASALTGEVSPHTVNVAWLTPGAPSPAGVELDGPGARWAPPSRDGLTRLPPMRVRAAEKAAGERPARVQLHRKLLAKRGGCPREQVEPAALAVYRS
ncbi:hypothetical protein [Longimicrobium sp.]|uniref:hypothetical protein n=1 Tax=Longimicrobium sp. TaxID=2029185 RepID=UPI003B3B3EA1